VLGILSGFLAVLLAAAAGVHVWTPIGRQTGGPERVGVCKSLRNLVGPPRFELGTSCTPSKRASQAAPRPEKTFTHENSFAICLLYLTPQRFRTPPVYHALQGRRGCHESRDRRSTGGRVFRQCYRLHTRPRATPAESIHRTATGILLLTGLFFSLAAGGGMAGRQGFEPRYADPESAVLPLDDLPNGNRILALGTGHLGAPITS
jgi:hypothetical protein